MKNNSQKLSDLDFSNYSNIESFRDKLKELRNFDFSDKSKNEIYDIIFSYIDIIPSLSAFISVENFNNYNFYRVRLNPDLAKEDIRLVNTFSYPLPQFCKENGRANLKNRSVFYCSNHAMTAILESKPRVGDKGYLSIWKGKTTKEMKAGILLPKDLRRENIWHALSDNMHLFSNSFLDKNSGKSIFYKESINFIAQLFLNENFPYPITSCISDIQLYGEQPKNFIIYPSFTNEAYSCNFAIHPNIVDGYLNFSKVIRFNVEEIHNGTYKLSTGPIGEIIDNNIKFRPPLKDEQDFSTFPI